MSQFYHTALSFLFLFSFVQVGIGQIKTSDHHYIDVNLDADAGPLQLEICGLEPGNEYSFQLEGNEPLRKPANIALQGGIPLEEGNSPYYFRALKECVQLTVLLSPLVQGMNDPVGYTHRCRTCTDNDSEGDRSISVWFQPLNSIIRSILMYGAGCWDIRNMTSTGASLSLGACSGPPGPPGVGMIMSTGVVTDAMGFNDAMDTSTDFGQPGDWDLTAMSPQNHPTFDASVVEFDFTAPFDGFLVYTVVFASEEYPERDVCDAFGIFVSGPGILGPYLGNAANFAVIPNTFHPINACTISPTVNDKLYVNNKDGKEDTQYDGLTVPIEVRIPIQECGDYHIKFAIADTEDGIYDSAIFIRGNSFTNVFLSTIEAFVPSTGTNVVYEECNDAFFRVCKENPDDWHIDVFVDYTVSPASTAIWGIDYEALPPYFHIPSGDMCVDIPVTLINDQIPSGDKTLIIDLESPCECVFPTAELIIREAPALEISFDDISICQDEVLVHGPEILSGVPNYTYLWSDGSTDSELDFLAEEFGSTLYKVSITDQCGRVAVDSAWVDIQPRPIATMEGDGTLCVGSTEDTVFVTITLSPPISAPWGLSYYLNGVLQPVLTELTDSVIIIPVTSPGYNEILDVWNNTVCVGYTFGSSFIEGILIEADIDTIGVSCFGAMDGKITITPEGGIFPYSYKWSVPGETGPVLDSLDVGEYRVTVTDDFGCTYIDTIILDSHSDIDIDGVLVKGADCLASTGEMELHVTGGTLPYTFLWSNGSTAQNPTNLPKGTATVTVTDDRGCQSYASYDIPGLEAPIVEIEVIGVDCTTPTGGQAILDVIGGTMPYSFQWSGNVGNQQNPTGLAGGTYFVTVTDDAGCEVIATVEVPVDTLAPIAYTIPEQTLFCGAVALYLFGQGSSEGPEFEYQWSTPNGQILQDGNTLQPLIGLPGTYTLVVTNTLNGCTDTAIALVIADPNAPVIQFSPPDTLTCLVTTIMLDASGSSSGPDFNIIWTTNNGIILSGGNTLTPTVGGPGIYRLILTNLLTDCAVILDITVIELDPDLEANIASPEVLTCTDPTITLDGMGSTIVPGTNFQWSTTDGSIVGGNGTPTIEVDAAGEYTLILTDPQSGCADTVSVQVTSEQVYPVALIEPSNEITCLVTSVDLEGSGSSQGPEMTYQWTTVNGNITGSTNGTNTTVDGGGVYNLIVTNTLNGCTAISSITISMDTLSPEISAGPDDQLDCLNSEVTLQGNGQTFSGSPIISWSTVNGNILSGMNTFTPLVNGEGTYELLVTDSENGCTSTSIVTIITNLTIPNVTIADPAILTCASPEIILDASESDSGPDIVVAWTTANGSIVSGENTFTPTINQAGTYHILVVNADNGCRDSLTIDVTEDKVAPFADAGMPELIACLGDSVLLDGSASSSGANYIHQWFLDLNSPPVIDNAIQAYTVLGGTYTLIVTNTVNGCMDSSQVTVVSAGVGVEIDLPFDVSISESEEVRIEATTNILPENIISITWDPPTGLDRTDSLVVFAKPNSTIVYTLTIVDDRGCIGIDSITVYLLDPDIYVPTAFTPYNDDGVNDVLMIFAGDVGIAEIELFEIFNRSGAMVFQAKNFQPNDPTVGWDGYHVGQKLHPGVLVYYAQIRFTDDRVKTIKGEFVLID